VERTVRPPVVRSGCGGCGGCDGGGVWVSICSGGGVEVEEDCELLVSGGERGLGSTCHGDGGVG
jgi:hypothetical protein